MAKRPSDFVKAAIKAKITFTYSDGSPPDQYDVLDCLTGSERLAVVFMYDGTRYEAFIPTTPNPLTPFQGTFTKDGKSNPRDGINNIVFDENDNEAVITGDWTEDGWDQKMKIVFPKK